MAHADLDPGKKKVILRTTIIQFVLPAPAAGMELAKREPISPFFFFVLPQFISY